MRTKKRLLPALLLSAFAAAAAPSASAQQFTGVYVFGDSLSDAGYYRPWLASLGLPAPLVATLGRFTTNPGPVWSEIISSYYGVTPSASNASNGNIFAQGGARVTEPSASTPPGGAQRPVSTQITEYLTRTGGTADPGALYSVWAGGNDFLQNFSAFAAGQITQAQLQANVLGAAAAEIGQIGRLRAAGARYVLVFSLPDIGTTPFALGAGAAAAAGATALSEGYNTTLFLGLQQQGIRVIPVDVFSLLREVRATPAAFGFTNITGVACGPFPPANNSTSAQFCSAANLVAPNADTTYLFADGVHPTTATHRIVADFVKALIEGPTQYGLLTEAAVQARESHVRALNEGIALGRMQPVGKLGVFGGADRTNYDVSFAPMTGSLDSVSNTGTIGITYRTSDSVLVGASFGHARNRGNFSDNLGAYEVGEQVYSAFASVRMGGFYGTLLGSIADIDFSDIERNIRLGTATRAATASTEGSNSSVFATVGYDFTFGRFTIGPLAAVTVQNITVNGFDESGGGASGLRILEQNRKSEVWSLGARASMTFGNWTPWARITADEERRDDVRLVSAIPLTMASIGSTYDVPAYQPDSKYMTWSVGVNGTIVPNVGVSLGYHQVDSRGGVKQDGWHGLVSVSF
jgi:outer membrane lipase/esterase